MCSGPINLATPRSSSESYPAPQTMDVSFLLELSANDDLAAFKRAVEEGGLPLDTCAPWYTRSLGPVSSTCRRMGYEMRSPAMIAGQYGSTAVLGYIMGTKSIDVNLRCSSDGATALHCAAAGGSLEAVRILIDASADIDAVDAKGNRPGDVIAKQFSASTARQLEVLLKTRCPRVASPSKELEVRLSGEKKEFPFDSTLPDIKNGVYGTDEFRMYAFKVKPCSRAYSHDWTECPFVHPGENARRRDPRKYSYSCVPCPDFRKGSCLKGDACDYAHGVFECWLHPSQYRTRLCKDETSCNRRVCFFAHKPEELRTVNPTAASVSGLNLPIPGSVPPSASSLDRLTALLMMKRAPGSAMSPSASSTMGLQAEWMSSTGDILQPPAVQLPSSRLKSGLEEYQKKLLDEILSSASPLSSWKTSSSIAAVSAATGPRVSDYGDLFGSLEHSKLTQLQAKQFTGTNATRLQTNQSLDHQLLSGYGSNLPSSPNVMSSSSFDLEHSMAKAILNSRQAAFAKRSQSFTDRGASPRPPPGISPTPTSSPPSAALGVSNWGSPDGKLDWVIQGDELNKLKRSATFSFRSTGISNFEGFAPIAASKTPALEEPDFSWVQHLVKDGPPAINRLGMDMNGQHVLDLTWDQLYAEQDQVQTVP